jgi:hypothetical protein
VPIVELYTKARIGKEFLHRTFKLDQVFLGQRDLLDEATRAPPLSQNGTPSHRYLPVLRPAADSPQRPGRVGLAQARS